MMRWFSFGWKALCGVPFPVIPSASGDLTWQRLDEEDVLIALAKASALMMHDGITYEKFYIDDAFDCVNFAHTAKCYFDIIWARNHGVKGHGIPTQVVVYSDEKRGGHAVLKIAYSGKAHYFDGYPYEYGFKEKIMTKDEQAGIQAVGAG